MMLVVSKHSKTLTIYKETLYSEGEISISTHHCWRRISALGLHCGNEIQQENDLPALDAYELCIAVSIHKLWLH